MFDWRDYLDVADDLLARNPDDEASQRAALSRAYSAVFGVAREHLMAKRGLAVTSFNAHHHVWVAFARAPRGVEQRIAQEGNRLKRHRDLADYARSYPRLSGDAPRWVKRARRLVVDIDNLP